jgi:hypothetical protein
LTAPPVGPVLLLVLGFESKPRFVTLGVTVGQDKQDVQRLCRWLEGDERIRRLLELFSEIVNDAPPDGSEEAKPT